MALQELSMPNGCLEQGYPLRHLIALRRRAKLFFVPMCVIAWEYASSLFSAILLASCLIMRAADGPATYTGKHEWNEVTLLNLKYSLLIL